jgi:hypothetical protein
MFYKHSDTCSSRIKSNDYHRITCLSDIEESFTFSPVYRLVSKSNK